MCTHRRALPSACVGVSGSAYCVEGEVDSRYALKILERETPLADTERAALSVDEARSFSFESSSAIYVRRK